MTGNTTLPSTAETVTTDSTANDGTYRTNHDSGAGRRLSTSIVLAVSAALDTDPLDLEPQLYDVLDPDALDSLFSAESSGSEPRRVSFSIAECNVTVKSDGQICVKPSE